MHISRPRARLDIAILYLTRVFAALIDEKNLLVEYFACHGWVGVDTDIFHGNPARKGISSLTLIPRTSSVIMESR